MTIDDGFLLRSYSPYKAAQLAKNLQLRPNPVKPVVTLSNIDSKSITRYFIRGVDSCSEVLEIDSTQYTTFKTNPRFVVTTVSWKIVGKPYSSTTPYGAIDFGVEDYNKKQVELVDRTFGCLKEYIRDYLELWYSDDEGNRTFVRRGGVLNPPFPSVMIQTGSFIRSYVNIPLPTPSVTPSITPSSFPVPSVTPSISITPSITPSISITPSVTPSITPSPYIGNEGSWSGWAPLYPPIVTAGIAIITE